jgi:hypothetical protein
MSLQKHIDFAVFNKIDVRFEFPVILTHLICARPLVCVEAMDSNDLFFELAINSLHSEVSKYTDAISSSLDGNSTDSPILYSNMTSSVNGEFREIPLLLLQSICVILSIWNDQIISDESKNALQNMGDLLLYRDDNDAAEIRTPASVDQLAKGRSSISLENV